MKTLIILSAYFFTSFLINAHAGQSTSVSALNDPQIAAIVETANNGEIELAKLARVTTANDRVKNFASMMVDHHSENNAKVEQLMSKLDEKPVKNNVSEGLANDAQKTIDSQRRLTGTDYDRAYMDSQISMHKEVLRDLNQKLIPNASNGELRRMLEDTRETVQTHLATAESIRSSL